MHVAPRLAGKTAIVTGSARGIGRGIARAFAIAGADVALVDMLPAEASRAAVDEITAMGRRAIYIQADVAQVEDVRLMVDLVIAEFGHIDVLVNNAGVLSRRPFAQLTIDEWDHTIAVNLRGAFLCAHFAVPHMVSRRFGRIINIASQRGQIGGIDLCHYSASKGGVIAFTKALARELAPHNILVNAIAPGPIETDMNTPMMDDLRHRMEHLPIRRIGTVDEVAPSAVFLASDDASYYVGQTLGPNGGDVML